jgi:uncharacterized repeat protein (TIGR01451 family)
LRRLRIIEEGVRGMKASKILAVATVTGVLAATVGTNVFAAEVLAWHPKGVIKKSVMNQTTGSELADANDAASAVAAKPGETLKYVIEVRNDAKASDKNWNDMYFTKLTDTLPDGVELVSDPAKRQITEDLGVLKPGDKVTKEYLVKVTANKVVTIENEACFTGDSEVKDNPQKGCDTANVKVSIPPKEEPPVTTPQPEPPKPQVQAAQTELPETGASSIIAPLAAIGSGAVAYAGRLITLKRREQ